jgi:hypothetical protein
MERAFERHVRMLLLRRIVLVLLALLLPGGVVLLPLLVADIRKNGWGKRLVLGAPGVVTETQVRVPSRQPTSPVATTA